MKPSISQIREVRARTGLGLNEVVNAFKTVETFEEVFAVLRHRGIEIAERKQKRDASVGRLHSYVHNGKLGAMVEFRCETDFVAKSDEFQQFMLDICVHVAANPLPAGNLQWFGHEDSSFLAQPFVKDITRTVGDVVAEISAKTGEKVQIGSVLRLVAV